MMIVYLKMERTGNQKCVTMYSSLLIPHEQTLTSNTRVHMAIVKDTHYGIHVIQTL